MHKRNRQPTDFQTVREPKINNGITVSVDKIQRVGLTGNGREKSQKLSLQTPVVG